MSQDIEIEQDESGGFSHGGRRDDRMRSAPPPLSLAAIALSVLLVALWGGAPVAIKYSVVALPPIAVAAIRFGLAAGFMLFWCTLAGDGLRLHRNQFLPTGVLGLLLFCQISLFHLGVEASNSSHSTLLINTFVFWVAGFEHFITRTDRLSLLRFGGLVMAALGVVVVLSVTGGAGSAADPDARAVPRSPDQATVKTEGLRDLPGDLRSRYGRGPEIRVQREEDVASLGGDVLVLLSASLLAVKIIYTKQAVQTVEPGKLIFWHDVVGVMLFAAASFAFEDADLQTITDLSHPDMLPAIGGLLYQGVLVAGFCFAMQAYLLRRYSASQISVFAFATPLFGIVFAILLRGDPFSPGLLVAGLLVAAGIALVNRVPGKSD